MKKNKVILDSNFLLVPYKYHIDIFLEINCLIGNIYFVISKGILNELKSLSNKRGRTALEARFALKLIEKNKEKIKIVSSIEPVDGWILRYAKKYRAIVCTDDIKLKNSLRREKIRVLMVKSKSRIDYV